MYLDELTKLDRKLDICAAAHEIYEYVRRPDFDPENPEHVAELQCMLDDMKSDVDMHHEQLK